MLSAIGSSPTPGIGPVTGTSTAGIEAQIARYKKQLSDCLNCASAKTPEGKAAIEALSNKISAAETHIEKISTKNPPHQPPATNTATANNTHSVDSSVVGKTNAEPDPIQGMPGSTIGSLLDVMA